MTPSIAANLTWLVLGACLMLLALAGLWLVHGLGRREMADNGAHLLLLVVAAVAFYAVGFAFAMGNAGGLYPSLGALPGLGREWAPKGAGYGILGLQGFFLSGAAYDAGVYGLFLLQCALVLLAATIAIPPWAGRVPRIVAVVFALLFGGLLYPVAANWAWGGGWLAHLGETRQLGHGFVDFAGAGVVNAAAGLAALGGLLAIGDHASDDPGDDGPGSGALLGLLLVALGWIGLLAAMSSTATDVRLPVAAANALVAVICAAAVALLYTWFVAGNPDATIGAQAGVAGLVAISAGAPFFPARAAALSGGVAGLIVPFAAAALERTLKSRRGGAIVAVHGLGGVWGLLAVGLMADGGSGIGWNGIGVSAYLGVSGQGVTGLFPAAAAAADGSQLAAQIVGTAALILVGVVAWAVVRLGRSLLKR